MSQEEQISTTLSLRCSSVHCAGRFGITIDTDLLHHPAADRAREALESAAAAIGWRRDMTPTISPDFPTFRRIVCPACARSLTCAICGVGMCVCGHIARFEARWRP